MQDLEPPEVPLEMLSKATVVNEPKKEGFFKKLFSKKENSKNVDESIHGPELELPRFDLPPLDLSSPSMNVDRDLNSDVLPSVTEQFNAFKSDLNALETGKINNKSKGKAKKGVKRSIPKIDESSKFDWEREIQDQEILIHDSNRFNQDVNLLMTQADAHIEEKTQNLAENNFASEHLEMSPELQPLDVQEPNINLSEQAPELNQQMPLVDEDERKAFMKLSINHQKLQATLEKYLRNKKLFNNKDKMLTLFKMYDESVERMIEDKEMDLTKKKIQVNRFEKHLKDQEKEIQKTFAYIKTLDKKLKDRETNINSIISTAVEKELSRRLKIEKKALIDEVNKTKNLNNDLKKKVKIIDEDRVRFEKEHLNMSEMERKKLAELQSIYEKKLQELDAEKKVFNEEKRNFEEKRKDALALIKRSNAVSKELEEIEKTKAYIDSNKKYVDDSKKFLETELAEDRELKSAIEKAEVSLTKEKENLDKMIFSKYIENKLKSIKPEYLEKRQDWKTALRSNPLYDKIAQCKKLLLQRNLNAAKTLYNDIRKSYDDVHATRKEKEALYTAIRELYNDIQLKVVEAQMHTR